VERIFTTLLDYPTPESSRRCVRLATMLKLPLRATCYGIKLTHRLPLYHFKPSISTQSTSGYAQAIKKALDQSQMLELHHAGDRAAWPSAARQKLGPEQPKAAEQLVWLARRSLAASSAQNAVSTDRAEKNLPSHEKREGATPPTLDCTKSWDGPTVWAHLW
jgi:hypothetical protein